MSDSRHRNGPEAAKRTAEARPLFYSLANISAWAVVGPGVPEAELQALVDELGIQPRVGPFKTAQAFSALYDALEIRLAWQASRPAGLSPQQVSARARSRKIGNR